MLYQLLSKFSIYRLSIFGTPRWYLLRSSYFSSFHLKLEQNGSVRYLETIASSHFHLETDTRTLFKLVKDKYSLRHHPVRWLLRDIIDKRLLLGSDAVKEWRSNRILRRAGLQTVECRGIGIAFNVLNPFGSVYAMPYLEQTESGESHFKQLEESQRLAFLHRLCDEVLVLLRHGYYHRDLHYGNVMVGQQGELVWIDTHIRRLPRDKKARRQCLVRMLSPTKLQGQHYRDHAEHYIISHFQSAVANH